MKNVRLRSPCEKVDGLVYFGRMVDQIRAHAKGELPPKYQASLGEGLDEYCVNFLGVSYNLVVQYVNEGLSDGAILQSCFSMLQSYEQRSESSNPQPEQLQSVLAWPCLACSCPILDQSRIKSQLENERKLRGYCVNRSSYGFVSNDRKRDSSSLSAMDFPRACGDDQYWI